MSMQAVIGIDPGAHSAAALLTVAPAPALLAVLPHNFTAKSAYATPTAVIAELLRLAAAGGYAVSGAWVEGQFFRINPQSLILLARTAGRWQEACAGHGVPCSIVEPATWQARELREWRRVGDTKTAAIGRVAGIYKLKASEHVADAILIGRYAAVEAWGRAPQGRIV